VKNKKLNVIQIYKQLEDHLVPRLDLSVIDRAVYSHLLRHSHLEGKSRLRFSISWLARGTRLCPTTVRVALRRLISRRALRVVQRSTTTGHLVEVRLPEEIRAVCPPRIEPRPGREGRVPPPCVGSLEKTDFLQSRTLRQAIHSRERGRCFYCLSRLSNRVRCLDHVIPRARAGCNSYRNLVSCCMDCNSRKGETSASDFLRWLSRERRLTAPELNARLRALDALAAGKLRPPLPRPPSATALGTARASRVHSTRWIFRSKTTKN
jgi:5-methylcytosine-specific restriction endonuclease McrA